MSVPRSSIRPAIVALLLLAVAGTSRAAVKPHPLFTPGAVLQQGVNIPVWGTAAENEVVSVTLGGQTASATTNKAGKWKVTLSALPAGGPHVLKIAGENTIELPDVLIGEVWVCSGQSNMQWPVSASSDPDQTIANSANPRIRLFSVPLKATPEPQDLVDGSWSACGPETIASFTAVGYAFGRDLEAHLKVPVGLINTSYGGTPAEAWTSQATIQGNEILKAAYGATPASDSPGSPSGLFNAMIHPLLPYAIKGAIWYQGESNADRANQYRTLFPAMITDWRQQWGQGDFPFLFVQLAPYMAILPEPGESAWAELREAQLLTTQVLKNAGMAVITDLGDEADIHPQQKAPVGSRLALAARALAYGETLVYSGPVYEKMEVVENTIRLSFAHVGGGLVAKDGPLLGFTIAGDDRKFVKAQAEIDGQTVVVSSPSVAKPVAVRFGWANFPVVNFWNQDGLPATPFRTDEFPGITK